MTILTQQAKITYSKNFTPIPWTPSNIKNFLWLDANDSSTITTVSGSVSQWNDKSGNANHVTQGTASNRPAYQATGLNNLPTVCNDIL